MTEERVVGLESIPPEPRVARPTIAEREPKTQRKTKENLLFTARTVDEGKDFDAHHDHESKGETSDGEMFR